MKPKTLIAASCAACLLVLLTPGVISPDEPWAAGATAPGPPLRSELKVDPLPPDDEGRADRAESDSQLAPMDDLEGGGR